MRPLFVRKPRFRTQASRILLTSASSLIYQKSIMQSRSVHSVGSSLSRLIYSFVCVFVCLFYLFFFLPKSLWDQTFVPFRTETWPLWRTCRITTQRTEIHRKAFILHVWLLSSLTSEWKKKAEVVNLSRVWMSLKEDPLDKFLLLFFLQSNSVFTFCAWCFRESD